MICILDLMLCFRICWEVVGLSLPVSPAAPHVDLETI